MTKRIFIYMALIFAATSASGQNLASYKSRLAQPSTEGARVVVSEVGNAASVIRSAPAGNPNQMIECYRVEIFFDTSSNARKLTYDTYAKFRELFPEIPADEKSDISYRSPKYTVRVGYFLTRAEAIAMWGRLKVHFEQAYVRDEKIELSKFAQRAFPVQ